MDNDDLYSVASSSSYCHLMESEEDFPFGAKTTSFLPPATVTNAAASTSTTIATFDLPEWMEDRELLELPDVGMFESVLLHPLASTPLGSSLLKMEDVEDDYCFTIKPEDMLVPISDMQLPCTPSSPPLASTPPASPVHFSVSPPQVPASPPEVPASPPNVPASPPQVPASPLQAPAPALVTQARAPLPKIIIRCKVGTSNLKHKPVQVHYQVMPVRQIPQAASGTPVLGQTEPLAPSAASENSQGSQISDVPTEVSQVEPQVIPTEVSQVEPQVTGTFLEVPQGVVRAEVPHPCDAEELIDELVQMISSGSTVLHNLHNATSDSSEMDMEELLFHLEASDNSVESEPQSLSSLASISSLPPESPCSASFSPHPSESSSSDPLSPCSHSESKSPASTASLPSPVPSLGSISPAQSTSDSVFLCGETSYTGDCIDEEWSPLEETHSYSRSQRKVRPSRRALATRKTPYSEDRKERKKEQNKQAALRYRQKKKQEDDDLMSKIHAEEERQQRLKSTYAGLKQELSCLKKIMREVFVARGILSEEALKKAALAKKSASK